MWWFLVLLGVLVALAGLSVIALGVVIFQSTFGNTLITTGAVAASGGFVITAMGLVLRQLERLTRQMDRIAPEGEEAPAPRLSARAAVPRLTAEEAGEPEALPAAPVPPALPPAEPPRERLAAPSRPVPQLAPAEPSVEPADPMVEARRQRLQRRGDAPAPPVAPAAPPAASAPAAPSRPRTGYEPPARPARAAPEPEPAPRPEPEEPRILKSGIVGGMAYTLYSDGSIQADLPDGVVRFASLQELRDHVAQSQSGR
ncbi:hypothetical protein V5F49_00045 [Xanthobacter sp. V3C-3]|uniref:hypothetical protein n=1 Tax=Xanthobacter lutulentifluminis TaxID=3119935 RepID=UPI003728683F